MAKPNHHSLPYKMRADPNKTYKELKQKQKARISEWMFQSVSAYYDEYGRMPQGEDAEKIAKGIYHRVQSVAIWVPYEEFYLAFSAKLPRFESRLTQSRIAETTPKAEPSQDRPHTAMKKNTHAAAKKKSGSKTLCPVCGRKMKHQFHGLMHCKCGISWLRGEGFFERTSDMVFALERRRIGKKVKQCPVIRYRDMPKELDLQEYEEDV